ncbi:MAG: hypothetical protein ACK48Q_12565, partial [Burkholderiales bacterium]
MSDFFSPKIKSVIALSPWTVRTVWSTGESFDVDLTKQMKLKAFAEIRKPEIFKTVHLQYGCIE